MSERVTLYDAAGSRLTLGPGDHLATGGEGAVYAKGDRVFKVYLDPAKARRARLAEKAVLLQQLQHPGIAAPVGSLVDKQGEFLGLEFPRVTGEALCRLFTNTWRDANLFGVDETRGVTLGMRDVMQHAHSRQALMVDANELNWLVSGVRPVAIDVDSWQLPGFPATAIMPSIRDPKATKGFSEGSDWFAWAVVTFQLWTGVHPYKGTHPDFKRHALLERMQAQASVFDPRVSLPAAVRPVSDIPARLRDWYQAVFQAGERMAPPADFNLTVAPQTAPRLRVVRALNATLKQERVGGAGGSAALAFQGLVVARTPKGLVLWDALRKGPVPWVTPHDAAAMVARQAAYVRLPTGDALVSLIPGVGLSVRTDSGASSAPEQAPSRAQKLWQSGSRVFALVEGMPNGLHELAVSRLGSRSVVTIARQWPVSTLATDFFRGCFVQDCLGAPFLGVLEGEGLVQLPAPALKGYRVVEGLGLDQHNVWLTAVRKRDGQTVRMRMGNVGGQFLCEEETEVADLDLNGALLSSGVGVVRLGSDLRVSKAAARKVVADCGLPESARLFSLGSNLGLVDAGEVSRLSLG